MSDDQQKLTVGDKQSLTAGQQQIYDCIMELWTSGSEITNAGIRHKLGRNVSDRDISAARRVWNTQNAAAEANKAHLDTRLTKCVDNLAMMIKCTVGQLINDDRNSAQKTYAARLEAAELKNDDLKQQLADCQQELAKTQQALQAERAEAQKAAQENASLRTANANLSGENTILKGEVTKLQAMLDKINSMDTSLKLMAARSESSPQGGADKPPKPAAADGEQTSRK